MKDIGSSRLWGDDGFTHLFGNSRTYILTIEHVVIVSIVNIVGFTVHEQISIFIPFQN